MRVSVHVRKAVETRADVLVLGRHSDEARPGPETAAVDARLGGLLSRVLAAEKFEGIGYKPGMLGLPILADALASLECNTVHAYPGGDHTIFVGQIEAGASRDGDGAEPLLYYRVRYRQLSSPGGSL